MLAPEEVQTVKVVRSFEASSDAEISCRTGQILTLHSSEFGRHLENTGMVQIIHPTDMYRTGFVPANCIQNHTSF